MTAPLPLPVPTEIMPFTDSLAQQPVGFNRFHSGLWTVDEMKKKYLFGIPFTNDSGGILPNDVIADRVNIAASEFEMEFDQPLLPRTFVEKHDYKFQDYQKYCFVQLFRFPVISITQFQIYFHEPDPTSSSPAPVLIDFPAQWIRLAPAVGQIQITPNTAAISSFLISGAGDLPRIFAARAYFPQLLYIVYVAGYEANKIPLAIMDWVGKKAAIDLLRIAGDIALGAGILSTSIGLGGLSQSISSTKSNMGGAFAGRVKNYEDDVERLGKHIRKFYKGIKVSTV